MKHTFLLQYVLGVLLCGACWLFGMESDTVGQLKQDPPATSQDNLPAFTKLKKEHADKIALLSNAHKKAIEELTESLNQSRKQENVLKLSNAHLSSQMDALRQQKLEEINKSAALLKQKTALLLASQVSEKSLTTIREECDKKIKDILDDHEKSSSGKDTEINILSAKLGTKQNEHQKTSDELTKVQSAYAQVLFYKKLFFAAFLACALALAGHVFYIHHGFEALPWK